jgi:hydrogenase maturation protein HypF
MGLLFEGGMRPPVSTFDEVEDRTLSRMLARGINSPLTSSVGRLFDALASILGIRQVADYESHAAMELESIAADLDQASCWEPYPVDLTGGAPVVVDWGPCLQGVLSDLRGESKSGDSIARIALRFHQTLAAAIVAVARHVGIEQVALAGGCFQNRLLSELAICRLREAGFQVYWNQRIPPNDGGISVGQAYAVRENMVWHGDQL